MQHLRKYIEQELTGLYPQDEISALARHLLREIANNPAAEVAGCKNNNLSDARIRAIEDIVRRLQDYEPLQYILGETEFYGLPFHVNPSVLIPRPETEELLEWILRENRMEKPSVLDVGTGSGCIAVTLAKKIPSASVSAWDISAVALAVARENAILNNVRIDLAGKDALLASDDGQRFDIIVSNPPYITESEKGEMERNVLDYEPHTALFVPDDDALKFYRAIAATASRQLNPGGKLYFEINRAKGREVIELLRGRGFCRIELRKDISGNDRMIKAEKP